MADAAPAEFLLYVSECSIHWSMAEVSGYRTLPSYFNHPRTYARLSQEDFSTLQKTQMETAPPVCLGHLGTTIWYSESGGIRRFIVQIDLQNHGPVYVVTPCTFIPTFGMDQVDGMLAQDAEEWVLDRELGYRCDRFGIFEDADSVDTLTYLRARGFPPALEKVIRTQEEQPKQSPAQSKAQQSPKRWWQFWK